MGKKNHEWRDSPTDTLRVNAGFSIADFDCASTPGFTGHKRHSSQLMEERGRILSDLQERLFAEGRSEGNRSVLLVIQGMDTAGKGGIVRHVVGLVDPQGVQHHSFGVPTEEEKSHDYLWRIDNALPTPGHIGVFDRSHYEDVLVVRVHNYVEPAVWGKRYDEINAWEAKVVASGTRIVKCALMVSKEEQLNRLEERLDRPDKYWKYNPHDLDERSYWDAYMEAYQAAFDRCSTDIAPWHAIPADRKWFARLAVTELLTQALEDMNVTWPAAEFDIQTEKQRVAALRAAK
ncbi:polyphosphate kinase 2 family protein [Demequina lutea]|uniref:PPK2 family polyphosphate:nucleotide phosphotransferase n=1 Tax=Demequina lutea TaxID=431489 RepID=A0A7Z0CK22_9MICO|nr:polyphosphate kinase 2 family protein [Demequina lutea]NYI41280.1 PPK2 family polyphosphate:nucleotide phosphotransferase [Demequina lutea]